MRLEHHERQVLTKLMFSLLPVQILIAAIGAVNGIVSGYFASNYVGVEAMSAIGIYTPLSLLITTSASILVAGSSLLFGKYLGQNDREKMDRLFSTDIVMATVIGGILTVLLLLLGGFDLTGFLAKDPAVRSAFDKYLLGQAVGLIPFTIGSQLTSFLALENKTNWSLAGSISYIAVNVILNIVFVKNLGMEAFGLALASGIGMWVFCAVQAAFYLSGRSALSFHISEADRENQAAIIGVGLPTSATYLYQAGRGYIVNMLLQIYVGSVAISAFTAVNNTLAIFWSVNAAMINVSRMLMGISIGEEDRQTLTDIMRVMFTRFIPVMCGVAAFIMAMAWPFTYLYYKDPSQQVFSMTLSTFRLLPLCMPFSVMVTHFVTYAQATGKRAFVHLMSFLDGVFIVSLFSAILVPLIGLNGVSIANILNGAVGVAVIVVYAWMKNRHFPKNMDELMLIPENFGVAEDERIDISVRSMDDVVTVSENVQTFCREKGFDEKHSYIAALAIEEMAGNIVEHGFTKDKKKHAVDIRVVHKDGELIIRLKDDCVPFDPASRSTIVYEEDTYKNIGIHMIYEIVKSVEYQNILGLNVLMMKI